MISESETPKPLTEVEGIKSASNYLRGTILEGLVDSTTGAIAASDTQLTKFHGIYQQDDRDLRRERRQQKLEKAFMFMVRVRLPGGVCTPKQWLVLDDLAHRYGNQSLKLTTRQSFQFHGVLKGNLKTTIQGINRTLLDTVAACGDVNRNVMCNPNPDQSELHRKVYEISKKLSEHLSPKSRAYHEIWLNEEKVGGGEEPVEPVYGQSYLPRKFKIGICIPPRNDVDVLTHDLGLIAVVERGVLKGFNMTVGGGMGMSHGKVETYPRLGEDLGYVSLENVIPVSEAVVTTQRDFGDRTDRRHARLKYTIDDRGLDWFRSEVETRSGVRMEPVFPYHFETTSDRNGWTRGLNGNWNYTLHIMSGRIKDSENHLLKTALAELAGIHRGDFRLTPNQNLMIANIPESERSAVRELLTRYGFEKSHEAGGLRLNALSCVALPTCGLALSESERYLPQLVKRLESVLEDAGLREKPIVLRITGCPNGCARPYNAEIGIVGRAPGKFNLYLGGGFAGDRLNKLYKASLTEEELVEETSCLFKQYADKKKPGEHFGDFVIRAGYVKACSAGREFHD